LVLQKVRNNPVSEALFLKACGLGIVSGCTNRAAGMEDSGHSSCITQTFQRACDYNDPWACTMFGFHLSRGIGVAQDRERARQVLSKSCRFGETDQACSYARRLLKEIGD
ncbi:MAG: sel1 repeat family protein, partial [Bradyrhizobiaceae bacterium]|nr:sel1 repeat family protein [Bradyrhizobiaceae bacterium]